MEGHHPKVKENPFTRLTRKLFHRVDRSNARAPLSNVDSNESQYSSTSTIGAAGSKDDTDASQAQTENDIRTRDLWQAAYDKLDHSDQRILSENQSHDKSTNDNSHTVDILDRVIETTKGLYEDHKKQGWKIRRAGRDDINVRDAAQKILDATLSFKDIISNMVVFDPTGHASSAWMVVSLGLTMTKNHHDSQGAMFASSEFLADILARYTLTERMFYHDNDTETRDQMAKALVRVYTAILRYAAEVQNIQHAKFPKKLKNSVTAIPDQPLSQLKSSISEEDQTLQKWIQVDQSLNRKKEAEEILNGIDQTLACVQDLHRKFDLSALSGLYVAKNASFDSESGECFSKTREKLRRQIETWATSPDDKFLFWLKGKAGTGKSTISRTVARTFKNNQILGASFFFKADEDDRSKSKALFATIARQLASVIPQLIPDLTKAVQANAGITNSTVDVQFKELLYEPLLKLNAANLQNKALVIIIDALDECEPKEDIRKILALLPRLRESQSVYVRIFLTSRPEHQIRQGFKRIDSACYQDFALEEIPEPEIKSDISRFLENELSEVRKERSLSVDWPGNDIIQKLTAMAVPSFIFAATVCRLLNDDQSDPEDTLEAILVHEYEDSDLRKTYLPLFDRLFNNQIKNEELSRKDEQLIEQYRTVVGAIIVLQTPLSIDSLESLMDIRRNKIRLSLDQLHSVLNVPSDKTSPVKLFHLSFRDFLLDPELRKTRRFWVDEKVIHKRLARRCLAVMSEKLKRNICNLPSYGTERAEVRQDIIDRHLPPELQYSCRYWMHHLEQNSISEAEIFEFLKQHFLHWLEAMGLLGAISEAIATIERLQANIRLRSELDSEFISFLKDTEKFTISYSSIIDRAPLQTYGAALVFCPTESKMKKWFWGKQLPFIKSVKGIKDGWDSLLQTLEGHNGSVRAVAFSPDGKLVASASADKTVRLWDSATGTAQGEPLKGHNGWVMAVAFSPDGKLVASASDDKTVRLWDSATGTAQGEPLKGHNDLVRAVAFSPDGKLVASASDDKTVRLWDTATGTAQGEPLKGHNDLVRAVAFSPDGKLVASASVDKTVRLWDTATGTAQGEPLKGHNDLVWAVAFSPDGKLVASASADKTVRLWDSATGTAQGEPLKGHNGLVWAVAFSPDGKLVASASADKTVRLWDSATGTAQGEPLKGHNGSVWAVAFSPDGKLVASASADKTVRLWDSATGTAQGEPLKGHNGWVMAVAFSPDGKLVASASDDKTVRLWDTATGTAQGEPLKGHNGWVMAVAFSPDGKLVASASDDKRVRLWDTATGTAQGEPLKGHNGSVRAVAFSPDGKLVASASDDERVRLWDTATGTAQGEPLKGHNGSVRAVAFSPDGKLVASASADKTVRLWDTATGTAQGEPLKGHNDWVMAVAFSPNGKLVASASADETVRLWDTATGTAQGELQTNVVVHELQFSTDGQAIDTDRGRLDIRTLSLSDVSVPSTPGGELFVDKEWIIHGIEKILWLPPDYRAACAAVHGCFLAMGHTSGCVTRIEFENEKSSTSPPTAS